MTEKPNSYCVAGGFDASNTSIALAWLRGSINGKGRIIADQYGPTSIHFEATFQSEQDRDSWNQEFMTAVRLFEIRTLSEKDELMLCISNLPNLLDRVKMLESRVESLMLDNL